MNSEDKNKIISALLQKGAVLPCPRCGNNSFSLLDGYFNHSFQSELTNNVVFGGPAIASVAAVCKRCGYISHHAAGILGVAVDEISNSKSDGKV